MLSALLDTACQRYGSRGERLRLSQSLGDIRKVVADRVRAVARMEGARVRVGAEFVVS